MKKLVYRNILVSDLFEYVGYEYNGIDFNITHPTDVHTLDTNSFAYVNCEDYSLITESIHKDNILLISKDIIEGFVSLTCDNPEIMFYKIVNEFFMDNIEPFIDNGSDISKDAVLGSNVTICKNSFIGENVIIGNNCYIGRNVIIDGFVRIGNNCVIKDNAIIGSTPYSFIFCDGSYLEKPGFGSIVIGNNVLIGSGTTVERPQFGKTIFNDDVKIDDLVNIGTKCNVGKNTIISAGCVLCSNVIISENVSLGVNVSIRDNIKISNDVIIGMGAVVVKDISVAGKYVGNPARKI